MSTQTILTTREAADYLRMSNETLAHWRTRGAGPKFIRLGRSVRYRVEDLEQYLESQTCASTAGPTTAKRAKRGSR